MIYLAYNAYTLISVALSASAGISVPVSKAHLNSGARKTFTTVVKSVADEKNSWKKRWDEL